MRDFDKRGQSAFAITQILVKLIFSNTIDGRHQSRNLAVRPAAFTLVEVLVSVALIGLVFVAFYAALSSGFAAVNVARQNLRATQILAEKMEEFRTFSWDELNGGTIPTLFMAYFYPTNSDNPEPGGVIYTGAVTIASSGISESYATDLRKITVDLTWASGGIPRQRAMQTFVSQNGIRNFVY